MDRSFNNISLRSVRSGSHLFMITGLDGDPKILKMAKTKIIRAGLDIELDEGLSFELRILTALTTE